MTVPDPSESPPPSLWRTSIVTSAFSTCALWGVASVVQSTHSESFALVGALILTLPTVIGGLLAGSVIHAARLARRRGTVRPRDTALPASASRMEAPAAASETDRAVKWATVAAVACGVVALGSVTRARYLTALWTPAVFDGLWCGAFTLIARRLRGMSVRSLGAACGAAWTFAAFVIVFPLAAWYGLISSSPGAKSVGRLWSVLFGGGFGELVALIVAFAACVELGRSTYRLYRQRGLGR